MSCISCFFIWLVTFWGSSGKCKYYNWLTLEIRLSPGSAIVNCSGPQPLFHYSSRRSFEKTVFLVVCGHWSPCTFNSEVHQWPERCFLKCLEPNSFRAKPGSCFSLCLSLVEILKVSQRWELGVLAGLFWACVQPWAHRTPEPWCMWQSFEALITPHPSKSSSLASSCFRYTKMLHILTEI